MAIMLVNARAEENSGSGAELRKKLFVLERTLARQAETKEFKSLSEIVLSGREVQLPASVDPAGDEEDGGKASRNAEEGGGKGGNSEKGGEGKKGPGSVNLSLGGGRLTGYSYSSPGLDFTGWNVDGEDEGASEPGKKDEVWKRNDGEDTGDEKSSGGGSFGADKDKGGNSGVGGGVSSADRAGGIGLKLMMRDESLDLESMEKDGNMRNSFSGANREWFYGMQNYENFADFFKKDEETKDYTVTGVGLEFDLGGYEVGMLNYSKPPKRKSVVFFGNETEGPYRIKATNIIPGSEIVRVDGGELARGAGYEISYSKGEIFNRPDTNRRGAAARRRLQGRCAFALIQKR